MWPRVFRHRRAVRPTVSTGLIVPSVKRRQAGPMTTTVRILCFSSLVAASPFVFSEVLSGQESGGGNTTPTAPKRHLVTYPRNCCADHRRGREESCDDQGRCRDDRIVLMIWYSGRDYWLHVGPSIALQLPVLEAQVPKRQESQVVGGGCPPSITQVAKSLVESTDEVAVRERADALRIALAQGDRTKCEDAAAILAATQLSFEHHPDRDG